MTTTATISFLGTGSGYPSGDRYFSSSLLRAGGFHLLIDTGEPCVHLLENRGSLLRDIDAVLITHGHVDHIGGLPAFLQGCMLRERTKPLPIYLPGEMIAPVRAWIEALYLTEEGLGFTLFWYPWVNGERVEIQETLSFTPKRNLHLEQCYRTLPRADRDRLCDSYSLEIVAGDFCAFFSGDLASARDLVPLLPTFSGKGVRLVSVLICELSHFRAEELAEVLQEASIETLCLVHLSEDYAEDRSSLRLQMEELLPRIQDVLIPEDGETLDF